MRPRLPHSLLKNNIAYSIKRYKTICKATACCAAAAERSLLFRDAVVSCPFDPPRADAGGTWKGGISAARICRCAKRGKKELETLAASAPYPQADICYVSPLKRWRRDGKDFISRFDAAQVVTDFRETDFGGGKIRRPKKTLEGGPRLRALDAGGQIRHAARRRGETAGFCSARAPRSNTSSTGCLRTQTKSAAIVAHGGHGHGDFKRVWAAAGEVLRLADGARLRGIPCASRRGFGCAAWSRRCMRRSRRGKTGPKTAAISRSTVAREAADRAFGGEAEAETSRRQRKRWGRLTRMPFCAYNKTGFENRKVHIQSKGNDGKKTCGVWHREPVAGANRCSGAGGYLIPEPPCPKGAPPARANRRAGRSGSVSRAGAFSFLENQRDEVHEGPAPQGTAEIRVGTAKNSSRMQKRARCVFASGLLFSGFLYVRRDAHNVERRLPKIHPVPADQPPRPHVAESHDYAGADVGQRRFARRQPGIDSTR